jgi:hypothetical protein
MLDTPPLPSMVVPSLTVSDGDDTNGYSVPPQRHLKAAPSPGQVGLQGSSYIAASTAESSSRRSIAWRPKITIGTRVVISEPHVGDSEECMQVHVGGCCPPVVPFISSYRVVCEVVRCPNPRQVVVRSVHSVALCRGRGGLGGGGGAEDNSPRTSRAHSSASSLGGGTRGGGQKTISELDSVNDATLHHVHTMAPAPSPPPIASVPATVDGVNEASTPESLSPQDLSSPLGGIAVVKLSSRSAATPPPLLPLDNDEEDLSSNSEHQGTHSNATVGPASPLPPTTLNESMMRRSVSSTVIDSVTLQHTVPSHRVMTVLEYLLRQFGVLPQVQRLMSGRDYSSVVVILEQAGERIATMHLGELLTDPTEAAAAARLCQSFLILCGEDPSVLRDASTTYASRLRPELAILHSFRGHLLCSLRRFDEALSAASAALLLDPRCPESFHVAVKALFAQDRLDDALLVVNVASSSIVALSSEFRSLVTAVRASIFMRGALRNQRGLSVIPISPDEILRTIRLQSQVINKLCNTVTDRTALSLHTVEDNWQQVPHYPHNSTGGTGGAAFRLFPHKTLRCIAMRDFASSFITSAEESSSARGNPLTGSNSIPSSRSFADSMMSEGHGERVLIEVSPLLLPLTAVLPTEVRQKIKSTRLACGYCGWLLAPKSDILTAARLVHPGLERRVREHYPCRVAVACEGAGCGEMYCSEVCRVKAFVAYHELECEARESTTWRPVPTAVSSTDLFASTDGGLRWAIHKMAAMEAAAAGKQGTDASPLLGSYSPRRRVSDVVFTTSPTDDIASTSPVSGVNQHGNNNNPANLSNHSSNSNGSGPRPQRESSEEFCGTQSVAFAPTMEDSLPRRWSLAYEQQAAEIAAAGGITIQPHPPSSSASTVKDASLPFGTSSPTPTFSPQLSNNGGHRGSVTSELSSQAPSPHRPRQSKGQAMFSARFQAARRSSTTVRGSADVVASLRTSIKRAYHEVTDGELRQAPTHVRTAAAVFVRCLTTLLSLFFPATVAWDGAQRVQRQQRGGLHTKEHQVRKSNVLRAAIEACEARGVTHAGGRSDADKRDPHSLAIAEELFRRLGIPFTAVERSSHGVVTSTLPAVPAAGSPHQQLKRDSLLAPIAPGFPNSSARRSSKSQQQHAMSSGAAKVKDSGAADALHHMWVFVYSASSVIRLRCSDAAVAVTAACATNSSISGPQPSGPPSPRGGGGFGSAGHSSTPNSIFYAPPTPMSPFQSHRRVSAVWTLEDDGDSTSTSNPMLNTQTGTMSVLHNLVMKEEPNIWTIGRLLSFLEHPIFTEMLWDMCLTSHCIVPLCGPAAAVGPHVPRHLLDSWAMVSRSFQVGVVVLSRTLSLVTDWQREAAQDGGCGFDAVAAASSSSHVKQQRDGGGSGAVAAAPPQQALQVQVLSRFAAAPQSRSLSMVGSAADLRSSRGLLSLSSHGSRSSSSDDSGTGDESEGERDAPTPLDEGEHQHDDAIVMGGMMQASQWSMDLRSQRDTGGNIAVDPSDPAMCCPGERRIVLRSICPLRARDTLRLVMQVDAVDSFLAEFLEDPGCFRCSTTQLAFPM